MSSPYFQTSRSLEAARLGTEITNCFEFSLTSRYWCYQEPVKFQGNRTCLNPYCAASTLREIWETVVCSSLQNKSLSINIYNNGIDGPVHMCENPVISSFHYSDVIMGTMASQTTSLAIVYSGADQRKSSKLRVAGLCAGNSPVNSPHKWTVTPKMFPFDDVIMLLAHLKYNPIASLSFVMFFISSFPGEFLGTGAIIHQC